MKFGLYSSMMEPTLDRVYADLLDELREEVAICEEAGFHCAWVDEHHFNADYDCSTNPLMTGAMLAAHTDRIHVGQTNVAGCWQPLRLAEDIALLDHMTRGRVEVGLGRGISPFDVANLNPQLKGVWPDEAVRFDPKQQTASREHFAEVIEILRKAWVEEFFSHQGTYFKYPQDGFSWGSSAPPSDIDAVEDGKIVKMRLGPKPYQKPHPPLWMLMTSEPSFTEAAQLGMNGLVWIQPPRRLKQRMSIYAETRGSREGRKYEIGEEIAALRSVHVAPSYEEAKRDADHFFTPYYEVSARTRPASYWTDEDEKPNTNYELGWEFFRQQLLILAGSPEQVVEQIQELKELSGIKYIMVWSETGGLPHDKVMSSLDLFMTKVLPYV
jgi:alkanesulfonate monooxygenase SsuD/methylene tetrahydromethanopterin reductase-like flavin-dependent oxidoreductase (luciferase family)